MKQLLKDRTAIVTGSGQGTGKLFKLASDGTIGLWSDSTVVHEIHAPNRSWDAASLDRVDWPSFLSPAES